MWQPSWAIVPSGLLSPLCTGRGSTAVCSMRLLNKHLMRADELHTCLCS